MKTLMLAALLGAALVAPALAEDRHYLTVDEIADITGMKPLEVRLMLGAWSSNPYYRAGFEHVSREWRAAVAANGLLLSRGYDSAGHPIVLVQRAATGPVG